MGYSPQGRKESDTAEVTEHACTPSHQQNRGPRRDDSEGIFLKII